MDVPAAVCQRARHAADTQDDVSIHPWEQLVYSLRTQVTSLTHNVSAALADGLSHTFGLSWQPTGEPVWLLGRRYEARAECMACDEGGATPNAEPLGTAGAGSPEEFAAAWSQIARMTYRKGFAPMYRPASASLRAPAAGSAEQRRYIRLTSDAGWGCMIRVGQMLLATTLKRHHIADGESAEARATGGRAEQSGEQADLCRAASESAAVDADVGPEPSGAQDADQPLERQFLDDPSPQRSPFSIFGFIRAAIAGQELTQKLPGDWFGPTTISETIAALVSRSGELAGSLAVYVDSDGCLYEDEVRALACSTGGTVPPSPLLGPGALAAWQNCAAPARGACADSDDDFMVVSTPSVTSASAWSPLMSHVKSPPLCARSPPLACAQAPGEFEEASDPGAAVMACASFHELQPSPEFSMLELPGPAIDMIEEEGAEADWDLDEAGWPPEGSLGASWTAAAAAGGAGAARSASGRGGGEAGPADAGAAPPRPWQRAVLLLFPLQLGLGRHASEAHVDAVLRYFELASSLGAMGGRPRMAHFFVGRQGRELLYVDPHVVQPAALPEAAVADGAGAGVEGARGTAAEPDPFQNSQAVQTIPVEQIDSSISFAFYCRGEADLEELLDGLRRIEADEANPLVHSERTRPSALRQQQVWRPRSGPAAAAAALVPTELAAPPPGPAPPPQGARPPRRGPAAEGAVAAAEALLAGGGPCCEVPAAAASAPACVQAARPRAEPQAAHEPSPAAGSAAEAAAKGVVCVGSAWADGRWAEEDESEEDVCQVEETRCSDLVAEKRPWGIELFGPT